MANAVLQRIDGSALRYLTITIQELKSLNIPVSKHACKGLVHGINAELIETCCNCLRSNIEHIGQ